MLVPKTPHFLGVNNLLFLTCLHGQLAANHYVLGDKEVVLALIYDFFEILRIGSSKNVFLTPFFPHYSSPLMP